MAYIPHKEIKTYREKYIKHAIYFGNCNELKRVITSITLYINGCQTIGLCARLDSPKIAKAIFLVPCALPEACHSPIEK